MKRFNVATFGLALAAMLSGLPVSAQSTEPFEAKVYRFDDGAWANNVSENGKWAAYMQYHPENSLYNTAGKLINLETNETWDLTGGRRDLQSCSAMYVSNDGVVVGEYSDGTNFSLSNPAFWTREKGWTLLPYPPAQYGMDWEGAYMSGISADGRYACGYVYTAALVKEFAVLWELGDEPRIVDTPNLPRPSNDESRFTSISADGRWLGYRTGIMWGGGSYLYDRETKAVGNSPIKGKSYPGMQLGGGSFTPSAKYYYGRASGRLDGEAFSGFYKYDIANDKFDFYPAEELEDQMGVLMSDNGDCFTSTPTGVPVRTLYILGDGHWVALDDILSQQMNTNITALTGYADCVTGTPMGLSADGRHVALITYHIAGESYVAQFNESPTELAKQVDLLANYDVSPARDTQMTYLQTVRVLFERPIELLSDEAATLTDEDGNVVATALNHTIGTTTSTARQLSVIFRTRQLEHNKLYYVNIPAGKVSLVGDPKMANKKIRIRYVGREEKPIALTRINPENGAEISALNASVNPITLTFDAAVSITANAKGVLQTREGDIWADLCPMAFLAQGSTIIAYPVTDQHLFKGGEFRVKIDAGSFADLTGYNPCEEIEILYKGNYQPEIVIEDGVLFKEDFNTTAWLSHMMFYEGDKNQPNDQMIELGFMDNENYPFWPVRDSEEDTDWCLASHSCYVPAGKSDDWCILPQMFLPDERCTLSFLSQGYLRHHEDVLKVYVLETSDVYNFATETFIERFKREGQLIYDQVQDPGRVSSVLADDWTENHVSLADFANKYIYIAFVNENEDQSMFFLDNIEVTQDIDMTLMVQTPENQVAKESVSIYGMGKMTRAGIAINNGYTLILTDDNGTEIDRSTYTKALSYGDEFSFSFQRELPLAIGKRVPYTVTFEADGYRQSMHAYINNLAFRPQQRVVLEENTGMTCPNCPLGHIMIDRLKEAYGDNFIPIAIHAYNGGDALVSNQAYYAQTLELNAAPMAQINRKGGCFPMASDGANYYYSDPENPMWWDIVGQCFNEGTTAEINYGASRARYDGDKIYLPLEVRYAMDSRNNDLIFIVITEDGLSGFQSNAFCTLDSPALSPWGKGGQYGESIVMDFTFDHVARATYGTTYWGTGGLLPSQVEGGRTYSALMEVPVPATVENIDNCHVVTMLIDGNKREVINAVSSPIYEASGIDDIITDRDEAAQSGVAATYQAGIVTVTCEGEADVKVYNVAGALIAEGSGEDTIAVEVGAAPGILMVQVARDGEAPATVKLIAK